jgi:long-subunit acyl-CoA synthetase (AMP-forming)
MPLCHSFERMNILTHCVAGGRAAFHPGSVATILRTCVEVRPTSFSSTPRLWNVLYQDFNAALQLSTASREDVLADYTGRLGGRTQHIGTGGALTRKEVVDFLRECFQCSVIDGFGTTETGGLLWDGAPGSKVRAKLLDCVDFQYFSTDKPYPRGELCVSSSTMASEGYLGDPAATEAAFYVDEAGTAWYRTGDICEHRPRDKYHVVDRIKSVFKLSHGKFVAPQALEQLYETLSIVQQCWVTAAPWAEFTVAVVVVGRVAALAAGLDLGVDDVACSEHFNHGGALVRFVQSAMKDIAVAEGIPPFQHPRGIILQTTPWTADTGELTGRFHALAYRGSVPAFSEEMFGEQRHFDFKNCLSGCFPCFETESYGICVIRLFVVGRWGWGRNTQVETSGARAAVRVGGTSSIH